MYTSEILYYLTWPALIIVSLWAVKFAINKFEKMNKKEKAEG